MPTKKQILAGRKAVDAYRMAHTLLHKKPYHHKVHEDHTPLLDKMVSALGRLDLGSIDDFFKANTTLVDAELERCYVRTGECNRCGLCCPQSCPYLLPSKLCSIYGEGRNDICLLFPTIRDYLDIEGSVIPEDCGYVFTKTAKPTFDVRWF